MRDIGVDVNKPEGEWDGSKNCPFYGTLRATRADNLGSGGLRGNAGHCSSREADYKVHEEVREIPEEDQALFRAPPQLHRRAQPW